MEITVLNWDEYNPRKDLKSMPWIRIVNELPFSESLEELRPEECWVFICILCQCAKKLNPTINIKFSYWKKHFNLTEPIVRAAVEKLSSCENPTLEVVTNEPERIRSDQNGFVPKKREEKKREEKNIYTPDFLNLVEHWNSKNIITHTEKAYDGILKALKKKLRSCDHQAIREAINNYAEVLSGAEYFYSYKFSLEDFLKRDKNSRFYPDNFIKENYLSGRNHNSQSSEIDYDQLAEEAFGEE